MYGHQVVVFALKSIVQKNSFLCDTYLHGINIYKYLKRKKKFFLILYNLTKQYLLLHIFTGWYFRFSL